MKHHQSANHTTTDVAAKKKPAGSRAKGNGEGEGKGQGETNAGMSEKGREDIIRQTAYSFYEARSYVGGYDLDDWLQAEALVNQGTAKDSGAQNAPS